MDKMKMHTPNLVDENIDKIAQLFPNCVTESRDEEGNLKRAIDFDQLRQELSDSIVEGPQERYRLDWPGKKEALLLANAPIANTLRPCLDESVDFDTTENLFIEGDNLEALKLLRDTYLDKVKVVYIDPPYNRGDDFIYEDDFAEDTEEFLKKSMQKDESGNKLVANTDSNGRFHSDWLSMMYSRLKLARNLLKDDGVIFISIDENENSNLLKICDEVFGERNFISEIVWKKKTGAGSSIKYVFDEHEYVLAYSKKPELMESWRIRNEGDGNFKNPDGDLRGPWESCAFTAPSKNRNPNQLFMIEIHYDNLLDSYADLDSEGRIAFDKFEYNGNTVILRNVDKNGVSDLSEYDGEAKVARFIKRWAYASQNIKQIFEQNRVYFKNGNVPRFKKFKSEYEGKALRSIYFSEFSTQQGTDALRALFDGYSFVEYPKPIGLIKHLINGVADKNDVILDFFAGSATTAHAVMQLNSEDGGNRKFIMVQLPEECSENSEAYKAGYKTIAEISKERIRRAGKKILEGECHEDWNKDIGFRVLKVDSSNMEEVYYSPDKVEQTTLSLMQENIKSDRSPEDLLFQVMLDWGVELSLPIEKQELCRTEVFYVDDNVLAACFDDEGRVTNELVEEIAKRQPLRVVFRDAGFKDDSIKNNVESMFKLLSPNTKVKTI